MTNSKIEKAVAVVLFTLLAACGKQEEKKGQSMVEETNQYPAVVKLVKGSTLCTGTFVSPRAILTASHCLKEAGTSKVVASFGTFFSDKTIRLGSGDYRDAQDIGILYFDRDIANEEQIISLGNSDNEGEEVRMVGFGCNDLMTLSGGATKRTGTNQVESVDSFIQVTSTRTSERGLVNTANGAITCAGDSGGPLTKINDGKLELVGSTHGGAVTEARYLSLFVNITESGIRGFLVKANADLNLGIRGL